jgi:hypothetical protein
MKNVYKLFIMKRNVPFLAKTALIIVLGFLTLNLNARIIKTNDSGKTKLELRENSELKLKLVNYIGKLKFVFTDTENGKFVRIQIPGYTKSENVGAPELPFKGELIEVPANALPTVKIINYDVKEYKLSDVGIFNKVIPCQGPQSKCDDNLPFKWNKELYKINEFNNSPLVTVDVLGYMRGVRIGRVNINPVQYNPKKNIVRVYENLEFEITFEDADLSKTNNLKKRYYSPYFESTFKALINYKPLNIKGNLTKYPIKYAILTDAQFVDQLQPFIDWKIKKGFTVVLATTDEVGGNKEDVQQWLQGLYDSGTEEDPAPSFALFVGDVDQIEPWNNGNGVTDRNSCEYTGDLFPEIFYGRFSAQNADQLQPFIDKTLEYEMYTMPDPSYLDTVVMVAGMDASHGADWGNGQINYGIINYFNEDHGIFSHTYLWPNSGSNAANIHQNVSDGITFGNYTAHCSPSGWADPSFVISDIDDLQNDHKYGLLVGNCCSSSEFQTTCFAEEILRAPNKGAVGYIGGSNSTYWDEDYYFGVGYGSITENPPSYEETGLGMYDRAFHDHGEAFSEWYTTMDQHIFAGNLAVSESGSSRQQYYWDIYNLMGDPSLMIYYSVPDPMEVSAPAVILLGVSSMDVQTVPFSYVALSMNGQLKAAVLADTTGFAHLEFEPFTIPGEADFVITAQNYQPYISTIQIIPADGPYVTYGNNYVNDTLSGNGNGKIDYNEQVYISVGMKNVGSDPANDVNVTLSTEDEYIIIEDSVENYNTIDTNSTVLIANAFQVTAAANTPDGHVVKFMLTSVFDNDTTVSFFNEMIAAPVVEYSSYKIDDSNGDDNGKLDPGETVIMTVKIINSGMSKAFNVNGVLTVDNNMVSITQPEQSLGDLCPDSVSTAAFEVTADAEMAPGTIATFTIDLSADYGITASAQFVTIVGQKPVVVIDLADQTISADSMMKSFEKLTVAADLVNDIPDNLYEYQCAFVLLGIFSNNHVLTDDEGAKLAEFLDNGGNLYMEGGDTWAYNDQTDVHPYFHIVGLDDGSSSYEKIVGDTANFMQGFIFDYEGGNNWMDEIEAGDGAKVLLKNISTLYNGPAVITYENDVYKTIGSVGEFGGLVPGGIFGTGGDQALYMSKMLEFFGINYTWTGIDSKGSGKETSFNIYPNPAKDGVNVTVFSEKSSVAKIVVFDVAGKIVYTQNAKLVRGNNNFNLNLSKLRNGFYTIKISYEGDTSTEKLIITK